MKKKSEIPKINVTKNYRMFGRSADNREVDLKKHRRLYESMRRYGFLPCYPIICARDANKHLYVKEGQHRLAIAEELGLPVYWVETDVDFDVAVVNCTQKVWTPIDYAKKHAADNPDYREGLDFSEKHRLPIGITFALLAGTTTFGNVTAPFEDGTFQIKDRDWANAVVGIYGPITKMAPQVRSSTFLSACMAVCRVKEFDAKRMLQTAAQCQEKLIPYSTRDAYLDMMETIYNYHRKLVPLKIMAINAMRERNALEMKKKAA